MSRPSDTVVVWEAAHPVPRRQVRREKWQAVRYHYVRLVRTLITGTDPTKKGPRP